MDDGFALAPGIFDPLGARFAERAGFRAVYLTGSGTAAVQFGMMDCGLGQRDQIIALAARVVRAVSIPVIADAEDGFGDLTEIEHTIRGFEEAGVAAIHMEDRRDGHRGGNALYDRDEAADRVRAAAAARSGMGLMLLARSDAPPVEGIARSVERGRAYLDAGADGLFFQGARSADDVATLARAFPDVLLLHNMSSRPTAPALSAAELERLGYSIAVVPSLTMLAYAHALETVLADLVRDGSLDDVRVPLASRELVDDLLDTGPTSPGGDAR